MTIRDFFDLSQPITFSRKREAVTDASAPVSAPSAAVAADGTAAIAIPVPPAPAAPAETLPQSPSDSTELTLAWQLVIYLLLVLSIFSSRFLDLYRAGVLDQFRLDGPYLLFTAIASLLAFPVVYDRAELNRNRPIFVQLALVFAAGMGWEKIVATVIGK